MYPGPYCHDPGPGWCAMPKWHGFMQENFGTEAKAQMLKFSSNWAWDSDEDEASVQAATAPDP